MVWATARTSRTVCLAGLLWSASTWTSIGRPLRSPTTLTASTPPSRQSSSSSSRSSASGPPGSSDSAGEPPFAHSLATLVPPVGSPWKPPPAPCSPDADTIYGRATTQSEDDCDRCYPGGLRCRAVRAKLSVPHMLRGLGPGGHRGGPCTDEPIAGRRVVYLGVERARPRPE